MRRNRDRPTGVQSPNLQLNVGTRKGSAAKECRKDNFVLDRQKREEDNGVEKAHSRDDKQVPEIGVYHEGKRKAQSREMSKNRKTRQQEFMFKETRKDFTDLRVDSSDSGDATSVQVQLQLLFGDLDEDCEGNAVRQQSTIAKMQIDFTEMQHCKIHRRELDAPPSCSSARY
ncbi:LAQU0S05e04786g1_1 [Lachancea quebecensis]|uniref:LAQU0S05e04786g1_1 n=1 Tax=Lachancea quebecensis TaxID=1654605 RepID=A0A0P1KRA6_9SACH|nr:LAQU0S05e04786g1_1 [Lachancea quebecensis]